MFRFENLLFLSTNIQLYRAEFHLVPIIGSTNFATSKNFEFFSFYLKLIHGTAYYNCVFVTIFLQNTYNKQCGDGEGERVSEWNLVIYLSLRQISTIITSYQNISAQFEILQSSSITLVYARIHTHTHTKALIWLLEWNI